MSVILVMSITTENNVDEVLIAECKKRFGFDTWSMLIAHLHEQFYVRTRRDRDFEFLYECVLYYFRTLKKDTISQPGRAYVEYIRILLECIENERK